MKSTQLIATIAILVLAQVAFTAEGSCDPNKCTDCQLVVGQKSCSQCHKSRLGVDGSCSGSSTGIANCEITGIVDSDVGCTLCSPGSHGERDSSDNLVSCYSTPISSSNCYYEEKLEGTSTAMCFGCKNGFTGSACDQELDEDPENCLAINPSSTASSPSCIVCKSSHYEDNGSCKPRESGVQKACESGESPDDAKEGENYYCVSCHTAGGYYAMGARGDVLKANKFLCGKYARVYTPIAWILGFVVLRFGF